MTALGIVVSEELLHTRNALQVYEISPHTRHFPYVLPMPRVPQGPESLWCLMSFFRLLCHRFLYQQEQWHLGHLALVSKHARDPPLTTIKYWLAMNKRVSSAILYSKHYHLSHLHAEGERCTDCLFQISHIYTLFFFYKMKGKHVPPSMPSLYSHFLLDNQEHAITNMLCLWALFVSGHPHSRKER